MLAQVVECPGLGEEKEVVTEVTGDEGQSSSFLRATGGSVYRRSNVWRHVLAAFPQRYLARSLVVLRSGFMQEPCSLCDEGRLVQAKDVEGRYLLCCIPCFTMQLDPRTYAVIESGSCRVRCSLRVKLLVQLGDDASSQIASSTHMATQIS